MSDSDLLPDRSSGEGSHSAPEESARSDSIVLPDGSKASSLTSVKTERGIQRETEDTKFVPVIIKRSDASLRHPDDALEQAIEAGMEQVQRPTFSLVLSSVAAGMIVGFSAMAVAVVTKAMLPVESAVLTRLATATVYPLGFLICVMSGAQLYTEHTATAVYPFLDRRSTLLQLLRLWSLVIVGNLTGAAIIATLLCQADAVIDAKVGYIAVGHHLVGFESSQLIVSALLAGWLMALGAWLVMTTHSSQAMGIYIVTFLIGLGGLHHSIAGAAEMFAALFISDKFTAAEAFEFIATALVGNMIGGSLFVGALNYAHIRQTQSK